jgi:hypothetical protein
MRLLYAIPNRCTRKTPLDNFVVGEGLSSCLEHQLDPPLPLWLRELQASVLLEDRAVATVLLRILLRTADHLGEPDRYILDAKTPSERL